MTVNMDDNKKFTIQLMIAIFLGVLVIILPAVLYDCYRCCKEFKHVTQNALAEHGLDTLTHLKESDSR